MAKTVVDALYEEFSSIVEILDAERQPSLRSSAESNFKKSLLLCAASYFEFQITSHVFQFTENVVGGDKLVPSLVRRKAIERQYHTWFDWNARNAQAFFRLFGNDFVDYMKNEISTNDWLEVSIIDFIELGRDRNRLVHQNYGMVVLEKTVNEIYDQFHSAEKFVSSLPKALLDCSSILKAIGTYIRV